jgi:arylsulfatase A-like enzyme
MTTICFCRFCRALFLLATLLEFSATAQPSLTLTNAADQAIARRTSIIFVQVNGLGYGDLSCYGQTNFQTPNLDKLAAKGIQFTNYFVGSANALMPDGICVAQILKDSGYHTGLIGHWDLGDENSGTAPWEKGFDEFAGYFDANDAENFYANYIWSLPPRFSYDKTSGKFVEWIPGQGPHVGGKEMIYSNTQGKNQYIPDQLTKSALNFVQNNLPDRFNHYRPFFLSVAYEIPAGKIEVPTDAPFSEESWPQPEKNKAALISRIDGYIGQLQEQLQKIGMTNNIVIFFSSASVPKKTSLIDPDFFHSNISADDIRVPMIANWPEKIPAGQVSDYKWSAKDLLPTVSEIGFAKLPPDIIETSVLPAMLGQAPK